MNTLDLTFRVTQVREITTSRLLEEDEILTTINNSWPQPEPEIEVSVNGGPFEPWNEDWFPPVDLKLRPDFAPTVPENLEFAGLPFTVTGWDGEFHRIEFPDGRTADASPEEIALL